MRPGIYWSSLPAYIYFLAFPLLTAFVLVLLPWFALVKTRSVSANLLDVSGFGIACVTLGSCSLAWTVMLTGWTILRHGGERFQVSPVITAPEHINLPDIGLFAILAVPTIFYSARYSVMQGTCRLQAAVAGVAGGMIISAAVSSAVLTIIPQTLDLLRDVLGPLLSHLGPGFSDKQGRLYPEHAAAIIAFLAAATLYVGIGFLKLERKLPLVPSLTYLLLFLVLLCWGLSSLGFLLDRFRVPVAVVICAWLSITSLFSNTDHFFHVWKLGNTPFPTSPTPKEVLENSPYDSVIAVAANGGGIQSAAWTARVLVGLELMAREGFPDDPRIFTQTLKLISSVSGGSVGAMFFVNAFKAEHKGLPPEAEALDRIIRNAEASSLDEVTWGLFYPDFLKTILPLPGLHRKDRGHALEVAFTRKDRGVSEALASWRQGVLDGWRPATTFNATLSDTGERLLLSTADLNPRSGDARKNFSELFHGESNQNDIQLSIASAARLSATFPYVTPAARADLGGPGKGQWHIVDGGYYDNYGMSTLVEWLNEGLCAAPKGVKRLLILQIRGLPPDDAGKPGTKRGWLYQLFAPIATMFNVRSCGQLSHNNVEYGLLQDYWRKQGVQVETVVFQFPSRKVLGDDPPLSWHLTPRQKLDIENAWKTPEVEKALRDVGRFLKGISRNEVGMAARI